MGSAAPPLSTTAAPIAPAGPTTLGLAAAPVLPLTAAVAIGIAASPHLALSPAGLLGAALALVALGTVALALGSARGATLAVLATLAVIGAVRERSPELVGTHVAMLHLPSPVTIEGRLAAEPTRFTAERARLLIDVEACVAGAGRRPATGRVQISVFGAMAPLGEGQRVSVEARLYRPIGFRNPGGLDYPAQLRRQGILLVGTTRADRVTALAPDRPPWPVAVRRWAVNAIRARLPPGSAALLAGLLLGDRTALPPETDDAFRRAGVYHLLAVSGFNVALLASSVFAMLAIVGVGRRAAALVAAAVLVVFALVVGGQPSVLRATVMGLLVLASVLLERESQVMNALALAALALLLFRPDDLFEPGFQLSFAATAGIVYLAPAVTAWLEAARWPTWLARAGGVSLAAQLAVTPVMLAWFNQLSLIGVVANLFVVPLAGPATTLGMLAVALSGLSDMLAGLCFQALWLLLLGLRAVVWVAAAIPGAMVHLPAPAWMAIAAWYGALVLAPLRTVHRFAAPAAVALLAIAVGLAIAPWLARGDGRLRVTFLDVGQGDAALVELPDGPRLLVDGGPGGAGRLDAGEHVLAPFLWNRPATRLDAVALSHPDADHAGGLAAVLRYFTVGEFWETGTWSAGADDTRRALAQARVPRRVLATGQQIRLGDALIIVVNPPADADPAASTNDRSLVLRLDWRGVSLLLTGDLGREGEARILARPAPLRVTALKVAHHGSRLSSTAPFLAAARPAVAIISVGARNPFRHPTPETLARLGAAGARVYRTDRDGAVILETDGQRLWMTRWAQHSTEVVDLDGAGAARAPSDDAAPPPASSGAPIEP